MPDPCAKSSDGLTSAPLPLAAYSASSGTFPPPSGRGTEWDGVTIFAYASPGARVKFRHTAQSRIVELNRSSRWQVTISI
jgi:hypothetical protein